jgi:hypothetical protein
MRRTRAEKPRTRFSIRSPLAITIILASSVLAGCGGNASPSETDPSSAPPLPPPAVAKREWLSAQDLLTPSGSAITPIDNRFYVAVGTEQAAMHTFRGRLTVQPGAMFGTTPDSNFGQTGLLRFPGFSTEFFTSGGWLVPSNRGILERLDTRSNWRVILSPGRTWSEKVDEGWSRASFPFALVSDTTNEAHNGLATFVFRDGEISDVQFQVVQETASWNRNDFWGRVPATYAPGQVQGEGVLTDAFAAELAHLLPTRPWSELASGMNADELWSEFTRGLDSDDVSAAGVIRNGVLYRKPCATRLGAYPYCDFMRHGAFSLTKSMGAALTLMRLAQKYGDGVYDLRITDFVPVSSEHHGWDQVRFIDVLNMATGIGDANPDRTVMDPLADENAVTLGAWSSVATEGDKLDAVFGQGDYSWGPGVVFRYNTTHTFVLAVAMDRYLKSREGEQARLWDMMLREVFAPIGIRAMPMMHTREGVIDGDTPLMGIGLYPTMDDTAKIAKLLQDGGRHQGVQLLSAAGVEDALFKTGKGLPTGERNTAGSALYHMSFWSLPHRARNGCLNQIPYMEGYGGNFVILMPNGLTALRFADADNYDIEALAGVAERIQPWC